MPFDAISTAELSVGKPLTNELLEKFRNRDEFLNGQVGTLGALTISNPSFEITDTAVAGGAGNWVFTPYTGGSGTVDTSTAVHGGQSVIITHPGGAGNGGGYYESDFFAVSTNAGYLIEYAINVKGGAVPAASVKRYKADQSSVDEVTLPNSTVVGTTGVFTKFSAGFLPSSVISANSSVNYIKLRLKGGTTDHSTAGTVNFDNVRIIEQPLTSAGNFVLEYSKPLFGITVTATNAQFPVHTVKMKHAGGYTFDFGGGSAISSAIIILNGVGLQQFVLAGDAYRTFSIPNATNLQYLKAGDEVAFKINTWAGTTGSATFGACAVRVSNPEFGGAGIAHGTTSAT